MNELGRCPKAGFFRRMYLRDSHRWRYYTKTGGPITFFCRECACGEQQRKQYKSTGKWVPFSFPFKYTFERELFDKAVEDLKN